MNHVLTIDIMLDGWVGIHVLLALLVVPKLVMMPPHHGLKNEKSWIPWMIGILIWMAYWPLELVNLANY